MRRDPRYRFLRNVNTAHLEVHDLDNEKLGPLECQIDEIIVAGHGYYLLTVNTKEDLARWFVQNPSYDGCNYCLHEFNRK